MKKIIKLTIWIIGVFSFLYLPYKLAMIVSKNKDRLLNKYQKYFQLICDWSELQPEEIQMYFLQRNIRTLGIYGGRNMGRLLYKQLLHSDIEIRYFIDKSSYANSFSTLPLCCPEDKLEYVDAIVVTPYMEFEDIKRKLLERNTVNVLSLEEIIYGIHKK